MGNILDTNIVISGLEIAFYLLTMLFCIHSAILAFHWFNYGKDANVAWSALALYLIGGAILLFTMASAIYFI